MFVSVTDQEKRRVAYELKSDSENARDIAASCGLAKLVGVRGNGPCKFSSCRECRRASLNRLAQLLES